MSPGARDTLKRALDAVMAQRAKEQESYRNYEDMLVSHLGWDREKAAELLERSQLSNNKQNTQSMASTATLEERATAYMVNEVKAELAEQIKAQGKDFKIDDKTVVGTESSGDTRKIILPVTMNKLQAAHNLVKQFEEEETLRTYNRTYENFFINDFIIVMQKLIPKFFGMLHVSKWNTEGRPASQDYIQIPVGFDAKGEMVYEKGYIGSIYAPVWQDAILDINVPGSIRVRAKMKFEKDVNEFLAEVERCLRSDSAVKGTSVTIKAVRGGLLAEPIKAKENKKIVLHDDVHRIVNNLVIPRMKEKAKTALLFTGDFGTGKTETALKVGIAAQHKFGRTFFYLHNSEMFQALIPYLKNYQPAVVFVEDVDQISAGDRDGAMNNLLNMLDGNELKNINCTFIFTTNNHDKIHPAMRRPGRIDQVVHFDYCSTEAVAKIFELWCEELKGAGNVDYLAAAKECPEKLQGAVVTEIARRALSYAMELNDGEITTEILKTAVSSMHHHIKFMRADQKKDHSMENMFGHVIYKAMMKAFPKLGDEIPDFADQPYRGLDA